MNNELEKIWKEAVVVYSGYYPSVCLEGLRTTTRESSGRRAGVPAEVKTEHLPNTNLEHYLYTNLLFQRSNQWRMY
jgi:hypothetical protein